MSEIDQTTPPVELIDEQTTFTLADLCRSCAVEAELIEARVAQGILEPTGRRGLGVNLAGAALALDLLERIEALDARLRAMQGSRLR